MVRASEHGSGASARRVLGGAAALATLLEASGAAAGGFELPDNGAQALGRGAAFVAKASDGTAIYHNPAGLARQRGTHVLLDGNLYLHRFQFLRAGAYPDDPDDPATPWGGAPYPQASNKGGPLFKPLLAITSDFGTFDRLTLGAGVFSPPTLTNRTFPLDIGGAPSPTRYDFVQSRSSLLYPTIAAGFRVTPWLDVGVSGHLVLASFDQTRVTYADFGPERCKENEADGERLKEDYRCDLRSTLKASATSFAATIGAMARPTESLAFGVSLRTPTNLSASGTLRPDVPPAALPPDQELRPGAATYALQLPWALRAGGRYIGMDRDFELYDLELDVTYEAWGASQGLGPILGASDLGAFRNIEAVVQHGYKNTYGVRAGGAYNIDTGDGLVAIRGGAFFDSSATSFADTRLDYDTLAKIAGTAGLGIELGSVTLNLAYAAIASVPRTVGFGDADVRPLNDLARGRTTGADRAPLPAVNAGGYTGFTHTIALGASVSIDSFLGPPRPIRYGNPYEPHYVGPGAVGAQPEATKPAAVPPPPATREDDDDEPTTPGEETPAPRAPDDGRPDGADAKPAPPEEDGRSTAPPAKPSRDVPAPAVEAAPPPPPPKKPARPEKPATRRSEWWEEPR